MSDFVFENNLIAGRFYGKALEGNPTSPGIDIWVKLPGALVAKINESGSDTTPATGDSSNMVLWMLLMIMSAGAICVVLTVAKRKGIFTK